MTDLVELTYNGGWNELNSMKWSLRIIVVLLILQYIFIMYGTVVVTNQLAIQNAYLQKIANH